MYEQSRSTLFSHFLGKYLNSYRNLPSSAWNVAAIVLVHNSGRMVSIFLAVYLLLELKLSEQWIGIIVVAFGLGAVVGSVLGGWLAVRMPPERTVVISLVLLGLGFIVLSAIRDPVQFTVLLFFCSAFDGMFRPPVMLILMADAAPRDRPRCYALYQTSLNIGYAVGAAIGGMLAEIYFPLIFWVDGATSLCAALCLVCLVKPQSRAPGPSSLPDEGQTIRRVNWPFLILCCVGFLNYCVINQRLSIYPLYLTTDYGMQPSTYGAMMMFNSLLIAAIGVLMTDWLKAFDQRLTVAMGSLLICGSFAMLPGGNTIHFAFLASVVFTFGEIMFLPSIVSLVYYWSQHQQAGRSIGFYFATQSACRALGPTVGIWSVSLLGSTLTWLGCGLMGVLTVVLVLGFLPEDRKEYYAF